MFKKIINLIKGKRCFRCGSRLQKSELPDYTYYCKKCDEDFYSIEQDNGGIFRRFDFVNEEKEADTIYKNKKAVIDDATRFYHEHFTQEDDYDEKFEVKTFEQALEFWECNGYEIK